MEESFETYRSYFFAIAYRMLGSTMDAKDMEQETYIRYQAAKPETIHSLKAYSPPSSRACGWINSI
ncbi:MAG: sigma factor [Ktedonobacteraceae bacterium]